MPSRAYMTGRRAAAALFKGAEWVRTGPGPQAGALPPVSRPNWTTAARGPSMPLTGGRGGPGLASGLGRLGKRLPIAAGLALGTGVGLGLMNSSLRMQVAPSQPIQQYYP